MEKNWSISLEHEDYEHDKELVIVDAIDAVQQTAKGYYVNVVTPAVFGNPDEYLTKELFSKFGAEIDVMFIDQCGCGGYVFRVWKRG
ncbi:MULTISPECIES: CGCGG family putative rSAM-modified RiPP protein [Neobacillus]|uniref:CGCGG family rSAM-modified RiPP protein n=1 Tax=Neobacillus rhizophilus TaxID=2833579 RepID=A0A942YWX1_9BACI|nr:MULTISPECIES: CGCGG family rSAM-modified RiPP protein [Neobacillus]MBS4214485.1 CGCGG family rSAM-modified RiPP protein [Neobacillus rhizophilus]MBU8918389.1 CGCGG family rSAM-modified RiPP protein [Bacillus sp. FJAT-29953]